MLHNTMRVGTTGYFDPMEKSKSDQDKHKRLTDALVANDVAVMQRDKDDEALSRDAYIGLVQLQGPRDRRRRQHHPDAGRPGPVAWKPRQAPAGGNGPLSTPDMCGPAPDPPRW